MIMTINRLLRLVAGAFVTLTALLAAVHSPHWLWLTAFVGLNLVQSAFTNWCPMMAILRRMGIADDTGAQSGASRRSCRQAGTTRVETPLPVRAVRR